MDINGNLPAPVKSNDLDAFLNSMASLEHQAGPRLRITQISLAGKEGKWYENVYDEATKTYSDRLFQDFTDASFIVSPLLTAYFCKWKYDENAQGNFVTSEFIKTDGNPLDLYKVTFKTSNSPGKQEIHSSYADYQAFKAEHAIFDKLTNKTKAPYDFYVSIYAFHQATGRVVKMEFKGSSRGAWFDFQPELKAIPDIKAMCQAKMRVGLERTALKTGEEYFMANFSFAGMNSDAEMQDVMTATNELLTFLAYKQRKASPGGQKAVEGGAAHEARTIEAQAPTAPVNVQVPAQPMSHMEAMTATTPPRAPTEGEEIRLEDIPF